VHLGRLAAAFAVGTALGVIVGRETAHQSVGRETMNAPPPPVVADPPPRLVSVDRAAPAPAPPVDADADEARSETPRPAPPTAGAARSAAPPASADSLAAERVLLDLARAALSREDGAAALDATKDHERRFENGVLAQEREAIAVRALALLGRATEARLRADRFRARFPGSVLLPSVEASIAPSAADQ
jgi:hypothetical protein